VGKAGESLRTLRDGPVGTVAGDLRDIVSFRCKFNHFSFIN
jgi:hypothetical protein